VALGAKLRRPSGFDGRMEIRASSEKREVVIDSDWISAVAMALLLLFAVLTAIGNVRAITRGHVPEVTYETVILAVYTGYLATRSGFGWLIRVGAAAIAVGATIRSVAHYAGLSWDVQHIAGINGLMLSLFAWIAIFVAMVQWFIGVVRVKRVRETKAMP
jgi:hypothetical protein